MSKDFLDIIARLKASHGLETDEKVASLLGLKKGNFSEYKRDNRIPYKQLARYAEQSGTSLDWILTGEGSMRRGPVAAPDHIFAADAGEGAYQPGVDKRDPPDISILVRKFLDIMRSDDEVTANALRENIKAFHLSIQRREREVLAAKKRPGEDCNDFKTPGSRREGKAS